MNERETATRPPASATARILSIGSLAAGAVFMGAFALSILGIASASVLVASAGVVVLLVTPVLGLLSSAVELRTYQPRVALLAVVVVVILAAATLIALATSR